MSNRNLKNNGVQLPFTDENFISKWQEWLQYRKERRLATYTPTGLKATFTKLKRISLESPMIAIQIIDQSLENGWQGLFELKPTFNGKAYQGTSQKPTPTGNVPTGGFGQF